MFQHSVPKSLRNGGKVALACLLCLFSVTGRGVAGDKYWVVGGTGGNYYFVPKAGYEEKFPNGHPATFTVITLSGTAYDPQANAPVTLSPTSGTAGNNMLPSTGSVAFTPTSNRDYAGECKVKLTFSRDKLPGGTPSTWWTVDKWVVSRITPVELAFKDDVALKKDKGQTDVPDTVYKDNNADGDADDAGEVNDPACYIMASRPKVTVKFDVYPGIGESKTMWIKGKGLGNDVDFKTSASITGTSFTLTDLQSADANEKVYGKVKICDAKITWSACLKASEPADGEYASVGTTSARSQGTTKLYVVLDTPEAPMATPWTDVLDLACDWAAEQTGKAGAIGAITSSLYARGSDTGLWYNFKTGGGSYTTNGTTLKLTQFLTDTQTSWRQMVNCTDCCNIVCCLSNALGVEAQYRKYNAAAGNAVQGEMQLNAMDFIGENNAVNGFTGWIDAGEVYGGVGHFFNFHQVAWFDSKIYDATARLDTDATPAQEKAENNSGELSVGVSEATFKTRALRHDGNYNEDMTHDATGSISVQ